VFMALIIPLIISGIIAETSAQTLSFAIAGTFLYVLFWTAICYWVSSLKENAPVILASLAGIWLVLAVLVPTGARVLIEGMRHLPSQAELIMSQREAVNDAWDLPFEATMTPFIEQHPEWTEHAGEFKGDGFDWRWYYSFQQVGDQTVGSLSEAYKNGRLERDNMAATLSLLSPPALVQRFFQSLASTDRKQALAYEDSVRRFHRELRTHYYPMLFKHEPFEPPAMSEQPSYMPLK
jgi:ABC-2 type transport system permease protein